MLKWMLILACTLSLTSPAYAWGDNEDDPNFQSMKDQYPGIFDNDNKSKQEDKYESPYDKTFYQKDAAKDDRIVNSYSKKRQEFGNPKKKSLGEIQREQLKPR